MAEDEQNTELEKITEQIEAALIRGDKRRASAIIDGCPQRFSTESSRFRELVHRVRQARDGRENIRAMLDQAEHLLANDDPDQAFTLFRKIIEISPDHRAARAGIQESRRKMDHRHTVNLLIGKVRKAREDGDLNAAREYCREWLQMEPENESAVSIMDTIQKGLARHRDVRVILNRGQELIELGRFPEALDCLEKVNDLDPDNKTGMELIRTVRRRMNQENRTADTRNVLDEVQRLIAREHYQSAITQLDTLDAEDGEFHADIALLRRKTRDGILDHQTETALAERLFYSLEKKDMDAARTWLEMIMNVNPDTEIFGILKQELDPEDYDDLTR